MSAPALPELVSSFTARAGPPRKHPLALTWGFSCRYLTNPALFGSRRRPQGRSNSPRALPHC